jgi:hypothetical protein
MRKTAQFTLTAWFALIASAAGAQTIAPASQPVGLPPARIVPTAVAVRTETPPAIDGRLDDAAWTQAPAVTAFTQRDPVEGAPASEATDVRIAYDSEAIYVAARLSDRSAVTSRLGRRDMALASSDWFRVSFDTYHDGRIGVQFDVNPAGVRRDATLGGTTGGLSGPPFGGGDGDLAWDAVWDVATTVDAAGWTAELRIPFSQLRFAPADEHTWGLQLERIIVRKQEHSLFSFRSKSEPAGVPAFGDMTGLRGIRPGRPLELVPYVLSNAGFVDTADNPLRGDREFGANAGVDARYRMTSSMIVSGTVNPDFGQVEVDPAIINLTAFEVRLEERRPFFVEGASNFRFGGNIVGPGANAAALLYSRRIGRPPQVGLNADSVDAPGVTEILGAAKISGKTANGWSLGVLNAVTSEERGRFIDANNVVQSALVEPRTNYFAGRLNREFRRGMSTFGGIVTSVNRDVSDRRAADGLRSSAYAGGVDFVHEWANRGWGLGGFLVGSQITGSAPSVQAVQRSSSRYYQRPDSNRLEVDPTATSMRGLAGTMQLRKQSGLHWTGDIWVGAVSPGFEINDAGFQQRSDRIATGGALRYSQRQPGRFLRSWGVSAVQNHTLNFDGDWIEKVIRLSGTVTLLNYWDVDVNSSYERERIDDRLTRGGPLASKPPSWTIRVGTGSDPRKSITGSLDVELAGDRVGSRTRGVTTLVDLRSSPRWNLSFGPRLVHVRQHAQYVATVADPLMTETFGARYIFAPLEQTELSLVTRVNYTFTPDLSLELYLQPLVSNGEYGALKEFTTPSAYEFAVYGTDVGSFTKSADRYTIDPDGLGPAGAFTVTDRTFTTRSLRGNAVLRWEYRPGSTLYLVWQQERLNPSRMPDFQVNRALGSLFEADGNNVFVLKWSYWFNP